MTMLWASQPSFNQFWFTYIIQLLKKKKKKPNFQYAGDIIMDYAGDIQN
jgi:hypothetical protein